MSSFEEVPRDDAGEDENYGDGLNAEQIANVMAGNERVEDEQLAGAEAVEDEVLGVQGRRILLPDSEPVDNGDVDDEYDPDFVIEKNLPEVDEMRRFLQICQQNPPKKDKKQTEDPSWWLHINKQLRTYLYSMAGANVSSTFARQSGKAYFKALANDVTAMLNTHVLKKTFVDGFLR